MYGQRPYVRDPRDRRRPVRRKARRAKRRAVIALVALAFAVTILLAAFGGSPGGPPAVATASTGAPASGAPRPEAIAQQGTLQLQLPVLQANRTAIGFHGAGADALPLQPIGRQKNEGLLSRMWHRIFGGGSGGTSWYQLSGGDGSATGAVDVGAPAGTDVYAPVSGTVLAIQPYILDGRQYGNQLDIQPAGAPTVVARLTHLRVDPSLAPGSLLTASTSRIGSIVDFSKVERQALAEFTTDVGNHVSIVLMPAAAPGLR